LPSLHDAAPRSGENPLPYQNASGDPVDGARRTRCPDETAEARAEEGIGPVHREADDQHARQHERELRGERDARVRELRDEDHEEENGFGVEHGCRIGMQEDARARPLRKLGRVRLDRRRRAPEPDPEQHEVCAACELEEGVGGRGGREQGAEAKYGGDEAGGVAERGAGDDGKRGATPLRERVKA
jgi:hypothetical protein